MVAGQSCGGGYKMGLALEKIKLGEAVHFLLSVFGMLISSRLRLTYVIPL